MKVKQSITVCLPAQMVKDLRSDAYRAGLSLSSYITMLLSKALEVER